MDSYINLLSLIEKRRVKFSKGQKKISDFIINNYDKAVYLTASELGKVTGVSESTIVRFATMLGFEGYPELQEALEKLAKENLIASKRLEVATSRFSKTNKHILKAVMQSDAQRIVDSVSNIDEEVFDLVVENITKARKIYVIGARSSATLASFFTFHLNLMREDVINIDLSMGSEIFEQIFRMKEDDLIVCFSFPRYSQRTIKAMEFATRQQANTVAITDNEEAPVCKFAQYRLIVNCDMVSVVDSLVAPMSLVNSILVAISVRRKIEIKEIYDKLENLWDENKVYSKTSDIILDMEAGTGK